jgi:sorting nexin-25
MQPTARPGGEEEGEGLPAAVRLVLLRVMDAAQVRLAETDLQAFFLRDVVQLCTRHLRDVRDAPPDRFPSHPCLASVETELAYLRRAVDALLTLLAPPSEVGSAGLRALLREVLAQAVLGPLVNILSDPDWINQQLVWHLSAMQEARADRSRSYLYADTFTAFCNMIKTSSDLETLHDMR